MANNFAGDANCKALWKRDSGALTTDSKGTNTLTNSGVAEDPVNKKEGTACGSWVDLDSDYMMIADASLNAGFPLKNGDATKVISVCAWGKIGNIAPTEGNEIFSRWDIANNKASFACAIGDDAGTITASIGFGFNGGVWKSIVPKYTSCPDPVRMATNA